MSNSYSGTLLDSGHCYIWPERVYPSSPLGVAIRVEGSRNMDTQECRRLAAFLLQAADFCDRSNTRVERLKAASHADAAALLDEIVSERRKAQGIE